MFCLSTVVEGGEFWEVTYIALIVNMPACFVLPAKTKLTSASQRTTTDTLVNCIRFAVLKPGLVRLSSGAKHFLRNWPLLMIQEKSGTPSLRQHVNSARLLCSSHLEDATVSSEEAVQTLNLNSS